MKGKSKDNYEKQLKYPPIKIFTEDGVIDTSKIPYQIVFVAELCSSYINRAPLFYAIPCQLKEKYDEGDVVSLRWDNIIKGQPGGIFPNAMIVEIWFRNNKFHTKLFGTGTIQLCGIRSMEEAIQLTNLLCDIFNKAEEYFNDLKRKKKSTVAALKWLKENSMGETFKVLNTFKLKKDAEFGNMQFCQKVIENRIKWPVSYDRVNDKLSDSETSSEDEDIVVPSRETDSKDNIKYNTTIPEEYKSFIDDLYTRCDDIVRKDIPYIALKARIGELVNIIRDKNKEPLNDRFVISEIKYVDCVRRYHLGFEINRYLLTKCLEKLGYDVYFPNVSGPKVSVKIYNDLEYDKNLLKNSKKSKGEKFTFNPRGSVTHDGPIEDVMDDTFTQFMQVIYEIKDQIMAVDNSIEHREPYESYEPYEPYEPYEYSETTTSKTRESYEAKIYIDTN